jgi:phosphoribosyl-ATP pyrophosphohydrolase
MPTGSYTSQLFAGGLDKIGAKINEEAGEVIEAAREPGDEGRAHLVREAADLLFHLMVLLAQRDTRLDEVEAELGRRFGVSGLEEKASRPTSS